MNNFNEYDEYDEYEKQGLKLKGRKKIFYFGDYYGYPKCCVKEFYYIQPNFLKKKNKKNMKRTTNSFNGFVPCFKHACMIEKNQIKLDELINNRKCQVPFCSKVIFV